MTSFVVALNRSPYVVHLHVPPRSRHKMGRCRGALPSATGSHGVLLAPVVMYEHCLHCFDDQHIRSSVIYEYTCQVPTYCICYKLSCRISYYMYSHQTFTASPTLVHTVKEARGIGDLTVCMHSTLAFLACKVVTRSSLSSTRHRQESGLA